MIQKCAFGLMVINDQRYASDLMIYPDGRVEDQWWRASGHRLEKGDIQPLLDAGPETLVVGTGIYGMMRIRAGLKTYLNAQNIALVSNRTTSAAQVFNQLKQNGRNVAGCFHLTC
jgi:hypothetical protein